MKKILIGVILLTMFLLPNKVMAKKIVCNNENYSITLELSNERTNVNKVTMITASSNYLYDIEYNVENSNVASITNLYNIDYKLNNNSVSNVTSTGVVKALSEGSTKINAVINFLNEGKVVKTCHLKIPFNVVSNNSNLEIELIYYIIVLFFGLVLLIAYILYYLKIKNKLKAFDKD